MSIVIKTNAADVMDAICPHLDQADDPDLWRLVVETILTDLCATRGTTMLIGRCSHWLRPHQTRWLAGGGFAAPYGYGGGTGRRMPQFDWSVRVSFDSERWREVHGAAEKLTVRVTIPSRTTRHRQAAIHVLWMPGREKQLRLYGYRKRASGWELVASEGIQ